MIAIVLFIFLAIWILLTKFAMKIGRHLFRRFRPDNPRAERWGAFWGFMLAMGWVFVYWAVEAVVVRIYAAEMCKQAGITVYVTPEQWKQMVGGEEAWKTIPYVNKFVNEKYPYPKQITFKGEQYKMAYQLDERIFAYSNDLYKKYTRTFRSVYYDVVTGTVLFYVAKSSTHSNQFLGLDFWRNAPDCFDFQDTELKREYVANFPTK